MFDFLQVHMMKKTVKYFKFEFPIICVATVEKRIKANLTSNCLFDLWEEREMVEFYILFLKSRKDMEFENIRLLCPILKLGKKVKTLEFYARF